MKLSIIIPIFNVEKYLEECLNCLFQIKMNEIEFICVNDGSSDNSKKIILSFLKKDQRFILIDKKNSGYGDTVNVGLKKARGEYVGILESDDKYVEGAVEQLLSIALSTEADVVKGNYYLFNELSDSKVLFENFKGFPYEECINSYQFEELFFTAPSIWSGIYRKSFLEENNINFLSTPGASYQDTSFSFKVWALAKKVYLIQKPIVYYRQDNAASSSNSSNKVFEIFKETDEMNRFLIDRKLRCFCEVCMVAKFRSFKWNMDRLNKDDKIRFLVRMHEDARKDCVAGSFKKKYWRDYDWMIMNNILFNLSGYCKAISENAEPRFINEVIYNALKNTPIYIISSSREGEVMLAELWNCGMDIIGYINNALINEMVSVSAPVFDLKDVDETSVILISSLEPKLSELLNYLITNNIQNYVVV